MPRANRLSTRQRLNMLERIKNLTIGEAQHLATQLILSYQPESVDEKIDEFEQPERVYESLKSPGPKKAAWELDRGPRHLRYSNRNET